MSFNLIICGIPPITSKYFNDHFDILDVYSSADTDKHVLVCGDLNARVGNLDQLNGYNYNMNPDTEINQHGKALLDVCESNLISPINMLNTDNNSFEGGFTFNRGNQRSQNDWILSSKNCIEYVVDFRIVDELSGISDHTPVSVKLEFPSEQNT